MRSAFHLIFFFTSTTSCGPSSSDHSSRGSSTRPFSHEPQHRHTVHRHGEVPLRRENGKSKRRNVRHVSSQPHLTTSRTARSRAEVVSVDHHMTALNSSTLAGISVFGIVLMTDLLLLSERHQCQWLHGLILQNSSKLLILHVLWDLEQQK